MGSLIEIFVIFLTVCIYVHWGVGMYLCVYRCPRVQKRSLLPNNVQDCTKNEHYLVNVVLEDQHFVIIIESCRQISLIQDLI